MDSPIRITRETEFYKGYIRFKVSASNESSYVVNDITLDFIYDEKLLHITDHDDFSVKNGKFMLGNIYGNQSRTLTLLFEPLTCAEGVEVRCQVNYADHEGKMHSIWMEPKKISVTCPIMKTDHDINIGRLKEFIEDLPNNDSRIYEIKNGFDLKKFSILAREVVEKHDIRHISTLRTRDEKTCEIWYYGKTKVSKDDIVMRISIFSEHHLMELFAATLKVEVLTGLIAEVGRDLKKIIEEKDNSTVNIQIKDSVVQRSNLLDMCNMDGTCDMNLIIEESVIQRSSVIPVDKESNLRTEKREEELLKMESSEPIKHQNTVRYTDYDSVIEKASLLMRAGNYPSAISLLKKPLDFNPENKRLESLFNRAKREWGQILIRENH